MRRNFKGHKSLSNELQLATTRKSVKQVYCNEKRERDITIGNLFNSHDPANSLDHKEVLSLVKF